VRALPLSGRRIVVTRPTGQAGALRDLIRQAGGEPLEIPALEIRESTDLACFYAVSNRLETFDAAIFVSRNAVRKAFELLGGRPWPAHVRVATVGGGSREELAARGIAGVIAPGGQADSEALLALPEFADVAGKRIAIFRGEGGRQLLAETLAARGARVEHAPCYRRMPPAASGGLLAAARKQGRLDAITVSSGEGLANFLAMLGADGPQGLAGAVWFVPHPRIAEEAARIGLAPVVVAGPGDAETAAALVAYFSGASYN
jgi:uroporphyrinogen-III synthase